jgi:precorrin isomerase
VAEKSSKARGKQGYRIFCRAIFAKMMFDLLETFRFSKAVVGNSHNQLAINGPELELCPQPLLYQQLERVFFKC